MSSDHIPQIPVDKVVGSVAGYSPKYSIKNTLLMGAITSLGLAACSPAQINQPVSSATSRTLQEAAQDT